MAWPKGKPKPPEVRAKIGAGRAAYLANNPDARARLAEHGRASLRALLPVAAAPGWAAPFPHQRWYRKMLDCGISPANARAAVEAAIAAERAAREAGNV